MLSVRELSLGRRLFSPRCSLLADIYQGLFGRAVWEETNCLNGIVGVLLSKGSCLFKAIGF